MQIFKFIKKLRNYANNFKNESLKISYDFDIDIVKNKEKKINEITMLISLNIDFSDFGYKYFFINLLKNDEILREYLNFFIQNKKEIKSILKEKENRTNLLFNLIKQKNEKIKNFLENKISLKQDKNEKEIILIETIHFLNKFSYFLLEKDFYQIYDKFNINDYKKFINKNLFDIQVEELIKENEKFLKNLIDEFNKTNENKKIINFEIDVNIKTNENINEIIKKYMEKEELNNDNNNEERLKELYYI